MDIYDKKQTILIVDDIAENIEIINNVLKDDYLIKVAMNGKKAIELACNGNPPDLILLDIMMPGIDGYEVCRQLKENLATRKIPIIFVTVKGEVNEEEKGFNLGAVDYIIKPLSPSIVKKRVRLHLDLYDQNRTLEKKVQQRTIELRESRLEIINRLSRAGEYKDHETGEHVIRMSQFCRLLSIGAGLNEEHVNLITQAAPMHDVGKIGVRDYILTKKGKLDEKEWEMMKMHTTIGADIIGEHGSDLLKLARMISLTHHEKWNGKGYPYGLKGEEIPIEGRIVAIADVFDALTIDRPYKKAWTVEKGYNLIIEESGKHFDPKLVKVFSKVFPQIIEVKKQY